MNCLPSQFGANKYNTKEKQLPTKGKKALTEVFRSDIMDISNKKALTLAKRGGKLRRALPLQDNRNLASVL